MNSDYRKTICIVYEFFMVFLILAVFLPVINIYSHFMGSDGGFVGIMFALAYVVAMAMGPTMFGASNRCPQCHRWNAMKTYSEVTGQKYAQKLNPAPLIGMSNSFNNPGPNPFFGIGMVPGVGIQDTYKTTRYCRYCGYRYYYNE